LIWQIAKKESDRIPNFLKVETGRSPLNSFSNVFILTQSSKKYEAYA